MWVWFGGDGGIYGTASQNNGESIGVQGLFDKHFV